MRSAILWTCLSCLLGVPLARSARAAAETPELKPIRKATSEQAREAQAGISLAIESAVKEDWDTAFALLNNAIGKKPDAAEGYLLRGLVYLHQGDAAAAMDQLATIVRYGLAFNPRFVEEKEMTRPFDRGILAWQQTEEKTGARKRAFADILVLRGMLFAASKQYERLRSDMNLALRLAPEHAEARVLHGFAFMELGDKPPALAEFDKALELKPGCTQALFHRGCCYFQSNKMDQALADFEAFLKACPDSGNGYFNRGMVYQARGKLPEALEDLNRAQVLMPDDTRVYALRAALFMRQEAYAKALADYQRLLDGAPGEPNSYLFRAAAYVKLKEYEKAWADVKKTRELGGRIPPDFLQDLQVASGRRE